jgi:hypothetical protein
MVGSAKGDFQNNSIKYLTKRRSEASDAQTTNNKVVQNLNPDFNVVRP